MDEKELDLSHVNEIDMECNFADDDDDFGSKITDNGEELVSDEVRSPVKTGIILDFNDGDNKLNYIPASNDKSDSRLPRENNFSDNSNIINNSNDFDDFSHVNEIDMETDYVDDDEFEFGDFYNSNIHYKDNYFKDEDNLDFSDDDQDIAFENKELTDDIIEEKRKPKTKKIITGEVEANYWDNMAKKHRATNKKGAYNSHFHIGGNPELEKDLFNHDMKVNTEHSFSDVISGGVTTEVTNSGSNVEGAAAVASGGEGCCESLNEQYTKKLNDIFDIIGFEVFKNSDGSYTALDSCDMIEDATYKNLTDLISGLNIYIEDCFICPLQIQSGEKLNTPKEWVDWYNDTNKKKYPKLAKDIEYCDLLANHLNDCNL